MNDLIPIDCKISVKICGLSARLYEDAGLTAKAYKIRKGAVQCLCIENNIPILRGASCSGEYGIPDWDGYHWYAVPLNSCLEDVPLEILQKMASIKEKASLYIATPRKPNDPRLLFKLPFHDASFIELARWE